VFRSRGEAIPKKSIALRGSKVSNSDGLVFVIATPGTLDKSIFLRAATSQDYNDWVYAISLLTGQ
jgi:hypothetical protein